MLYIGIDSGTNTGLAIWDSKKKEFLDIRTCHLHQALFRVKEMVDFSTEDITIIFEDARQRKWLPREMSESDYRGKLMGAGSVKRDSVIWQEFCEDNGIPYEATPPAKGMTKWSVDYFQRMTGWKGRTSNHARDAAILVWGR